MIINNLTEFDKYLHADVNFPNRQNFINTFDVFKKMCSSCRRSSHGQAIVEIKKIYRNLVLSNTEYIRNSLNNKDDKEIKFYIDGELIFEFIQK